LEGRDMKRPIVPLIKNIALALLTVACTILVVRLWFGGFQMRDFFSLSPNTSVSEMNPWDESIAYLIIESARITVSEDGVDYRVFYNNLSQNQVWIDSNLVIEHLIAEGVFVRSGSLNDEPLEELIASKNITIQYNFPMPSSFFREFFGIRPGFLSSHFDDFHKIIIVPSTLTEYTLDFFFINKQSQSFFIFTLYSNHHYNLVSESSLYNFPPDVLGNVVWTNPIQDLTLNAVTAHISFFFPSRLASITPSIINNIYTYYDGRRVGRFFPNNIAEFTAMPSNTNIDDFTRALLAAFDMINNDALAQIAVNPEVPKNEVILVDFKYNPETSVYYFYFDYILNNAILNLAHIDNLPTNIDHAIQIRVLGREVIFYRRLMINFSIEMPVLAIEHSYYENEGELP